MTRLRYQLLCYRSQSTYTVRKLLSLIRREKPDIIHTHTAKAGTLGRLAGVLYKLSLQFTAYSLQPKLIHTFHGHVLHSYFSRTKSIILPQDIPFEYKRHMTALVRVYEKDVDGNPIGKYVKAGNAEDHFAHARTYSEIALPLAASVGQAHNITSPL